MQTTTEDLKSSGYPLFDVYETVWIERTQFDAEDRFWTDYQFFKTERERFVSSPIPNGRDDPRNGKVGLGQSQTQW